MRRKKLRTTRKRLVLHLKMETIARMMMAADFHRKSAGQYAEDTLALHGLWLEKKIREEG